VKHADLNDLIHIQFREKKQVVHSNYVAENLQFFAHSYTYVVGIEKKKEERITANKIFASLILSSYPISDFINFF
jgi:hypothetical protein